MNNKKLILCLVAIAAVIFIGYLVYTPTKHTVETKGDNTPPIFSWRYAKASSLNLDGQPKTDVYLKATYSGSVINEKLIATTDGGCNDLPDANENQVAGTKVSQCYAAGAGYRFKVMQGESSYLVERKVIEEGTPDHATLTYKYEVVAEFPLN